MKDVIEQKIRQIKIDDIMIDILSKSTRTIPLQMLHSFKNKYKIPKEGHTVRVQVRKYINQDNNKAKQYMLFIKDVKFLKADDISRIFRLGSFFPDVTDSYSFTDVVTDSKEILDRLSQIIRKQEDANQKLKLIIDTEYYQIIRNLKHKRLEDGQSNEKHNKTSKEQNNINKIDKQMFNQDDVISKSKIFKERINHSVNHLLGLSIETLAKHESEIKELVNVISRSAKNGLITHDEAYNARRRLNNIERDILQYRKELRWASKK